MITPPVGFGSAESLPQAFSNFMQGFIGRKPVFSNGIQIGYLNDGNACRGVITLAPGAATNTDPSTWMTKDSFWRDVSVTSLCLKNNITPTWLKPEEAVKVVTNPVTGVKTLPGVTDAGNNVVGINPLYLAIGGGALGLLLLLRR